MKALILNSGVGKRMGTYTKNMPKCMAEIGKGYSIISWQLRLLHNCGIREVVITTGPFAETLENYIDSLKIEMDIKFVPNPEYSSTNYIYSIYCAREYLQNNILLLHGDLVMEPSVIKDFYSVSDSCIAVDSNLPLPEKDFKAQMEDGRVRAVGIEYFDSECVTCQPLYFFRKQDMVLWLDEIESFCTSGQRNVYAEKALNNITGMIKLLPIELNGRLCHEVDNADDLATISSRFKKEFELGRITL